jgi:hypothetical protein
MSEFDSTLKEMDLTARANLSASGVSSYEHYKAQLIADGDSPEDIELTLRGFIWDESEEEAFKELTATHGEGWHLR